MILLLNNTFTRILYLEYDQNMSAIESKPWLPSRLLMTVIMCSFEERNNTSIRKVCLIFYSQIVNKVK